MSTNLDAQAEIGLSGSGSAPSPAWPASCAGDLKLPVLIANQGIF